TTPLRPLSLVRSSSPESDSQSNRSSWYQLSDGYDLDFSTDPSVSDETGQAGPSSRTSADTNFRENSSSDISELLPDEVGGKNSFSPITESPTPSVASRYSLRSRSSRENISPGLDPFSDKQASPVTMRRRKRQVSNKSVSTATESEKDELSPPKASNLLEVSSTSTAYFPPNSPAHKLRQKSSLNTRLRSYLRKPLKRWGSDVIRHLDFLCWNT
ncbi:hypothetical protein ElyMa_002609600, partial [Elysia marginata]